MLFSIVAPPRPCTVSSPATSQIAARQESLTAFFEAGEPSPADARLKQLVGSTPKSIGAGDCLWRHAQWRHASHSDPTLHRAGARQT
ncbi:MAG: hypothetical protein U0P30_12200 [Vicinamibacterales bacterium]